MEQEKKEFTQEQYEEFISNTHGGKESKCWNDKKEVHNKLWYAEKWKKHSLLKKFMNIRR